MGLNGKKWRIQVFEKMGSCELKIFDSKSESEKRWGRHTEECIQGVRPQRAMDLLEDFCFCHPTFDYEGHALYVNSKWFSLSSIGAGLHKIGEFFNQSLVNNKEDEKK